MVHGFAIARAGCARDGQGPVVNVGPSTEKDLLVQKYMVAAPRAQAARALRLSLGREGRSKCPVCIWGNNWCSLEGLSESAMARNVPCQRGYDDPHP